MVAAAEDFIRKLGVPQLRVRPRGNLARIEVHRIYLGLVTGKAAEVAKGLKEPGYTYVTLDLQGFRSGSMNETPPGR